MLRKGIQGPCGTTTGPPLSYTACSPEGHVGSTFTETTTRTAAPGVVRVQPHSRLHGVLVPVTDAMLQGRFRSYHACSEQLSFGNFLNLAKVPWLGVGSAETQPPEPGL